MHTRAFKGMIKKNKKSSKQRVTAQDDPTELVQRIHGGDREAESQLIQKYSKPFLTLLRCKVKDPELAQDLHQDTFRVVLGRLRGKDLETQARWRIPLTEANKQVHSSSWCMFRSSSYNVQLSSNSY